MSFYKKNSFESGWDGFRLEYSLDKGDNWTPLGAVVGGWYDFANTVQTTSFPINQPYFNSTSATFALRSLDISFLGGNPNVAFRFVFKSDGSINSVGVAIDDFQISGASNDPLPVEMLSFKGKAKEEYNELYWVTAAESNNSGFEVERSASGFDWEKIGFVAGAGNSVSIKTYAYQDKNITLDGYYYRLKQIDFNGKYSYTKTIYISRNAKATSLIKSIFPNPFNTLVNVSFQEQISAELHVSLMDLTGKALFTKVYPSKNQDYLIDFSSISLPDGNYLLHLKSKDFSTSRKLVKLSSR
ncbi:MAG: T9SS type A sorting domain-containing protein [Bacteroidetes bacterium]|nr:T9SS type A sorting domain-containing protein [Bacteroidota bacterium]